MTRDRADVPAAPAAHATMDGMADPGDHDYFRAPVPKGQMRLPREQLDDRARLAAIRVKKYLGLTPADFEFLCGLAARGLAAEGGA